MNSEVQTAVIGQRRGKARRLDQWKLHRQAQPASRQHEWQRRGNEDECWLCLPLDDRTTWL